MKPIPAREPVELLEAELLPQRLLRTTNRGNNHIYVFTATEAPHLMRELGRLREITFRAAGAGTGKELDIDAYDLADKPYRQMVVWSPEHKEILGAYRYQLCSAAAQLKTGEADLATTKIFRLSQQFAVHYQHYTIELGRSFVARTSTQKQTANKGLFVLDNLWDGLATIIGKHPQLQYLLGKVTVYPSMDTEAKRLLYGFLSLYFGAKETLLEPRVADDRLPWPVRNSLPFKGNDYRSDHRLLSQLLRQRNTRIPPLINSYMGLSPSMQCFGTTINRGFGQVEDTGILLTIADMFTDKVGRHFRHG